MDFVQPGFGPQPVHEHLVVGLRAQLFGDRRLLVEREPRPAIAEAFRPRHAEIDHIAFEVRPVVRLLVEPHLPAQAEFRLQLRERQASLLVERRAERERQTVALVRLQLDVFLVLANDFQLVEFLEKTELLEQRMRARQPALRDIVGAATRAGGRW